MEDLLRPIYQGRTSEASTLGVLLIEKVKPNSPITDNLDVILLIIVEEAENPWYVKHYECNSKTCAMHIVTSERLMKWIVTSGYRKAVAWITYGKIIFDRNEYAAGLKEFIRSFPQRNRDLRKAIEFGKLVRSYNDAKDLYGQEQYKDAYSRMVQALHYLARLAIIENGYHPEVMLWNQVRQIDPEVFKLYNELIESKEDIDKRVQLMLLAADFTISRRVTKSAKHLLDVMQSKESSWTYEELKNHAETSPYMLDLTAIMAYLIEKEIIGVNLIETKGKGVFQRIYKINDDEYK